MDDVKKDIEIKPVEAGESGLEGLMMDVVDEESSSPIEEISLSDSEIDSPTEEVEEEIQSVSPFEEEIWEPGELVEPPLEVKTQVEKELSEAAKRYSAKEIEAAVSFLTKHGIDTTGLSDTDIVNKLTMIQQARAVASQVLSKGQVSDSINQLLKYVPKGMVGEFKRNRDEDINRSQAHGWIVFVNNGSAPESLTGSSDGRIILGDLILMVIPEEIYVGNRLARADRIAERRSRRKKKEKVVPVQGDNIASADPKVPIIQV